MDGIQPPVFATPKIEFDNSVLRGEQTNAFTAKGTISNSNEARHNSESGDGWSRPSVTTSGHKCGLEDRVPPEGAFPAIESKLSASAMKLLAGETECAALQGGARGDGNVTGGFSTRDRNGSTIAIDSRVLGTAQEHQTEAQQPPTEVATRPADTPAVYLNPMTGMLRLQGQTIGAVSQGKTTGAESKPAGQGAVAEPPRNGSLREPPASDAAVNEHVSVGGELNKSTDSRGAGAADPTTTSSACSNGLDMACTGESKTYQATVVERKSSRSSSSLNLEDFWRDGSDAHQSDRTARSGNDQILSLTVDSPSDYRSRSSMTDAAIASSVMLAGTIELAALQRPVSMGGPARSVAVVDSRSVQIDLQEQARDNLVEENASAGRASAAPVQSENSSTRDPASSLARGRARSEGPAGRVPEQDGGCSPENTVDVARAAVSYAIAASASSFPNLDSKYADNRGEVAPSNTIDESAIREAIVSETATVRNRRMDTNNSKESNSLLTASTTTRTGEGSTERNTSRGEITSRDSEAALSTTDDTVAVTSASGLVNAAKRKCPKGVASTAKRRSSRRKYSSEDIMLEMCMICLEKLSDATEGGGQKTLGLIDSCSHRYCYACILEWSKVTNKCPQCKHRFHTIKAVKELRRNHGRYRGVAVSVEDRDQKYSFVDVRDVVVLDPEVRCYASCLLRGAVDALQQSGWEFSVQCEQCSEWFHGLCIGFRDESAVPDLWLCQSCRRLPPHTLDQHSTRGRGSNVSGVRRGAFSSRGRGRVRNRAQGIGSSAGQDRPRHPVSGQEGGAQEVGDGTTSQSRNTLDLRRSVSTPVEEASSACPQQVLTITTASSSSPVRSLSTSSAPQTEDSTTISRGRGKKRRTRRSPLPSPPPPQAQVLMEPAGQEGGRPPLSQTIPVLMSQAIPPVEQKSADVAASVPPLLRGKGKRRRSQSTSAEVPPMQGRSSTRLAQTSLVSPQSVTGLASLVAVSLSQRGRGKPRPSNATSSSSPPIPMSGMPPSSHTSAVISLPDVPTPATSSHVLTAPSPPVPASAVPALTVQLATTSASEVQATAELEGTAASAISETKASAMPAPDVQGPAPLATAAASATPLPGTPAGADPGPTVSAQAVPSQSMPGPATAAATVFSPTVSATAASMASVQAPQVASSAVPAPATPAPAVLTSAVPAPPEVAPTGAGLSLPKQALPSAAFHWSAVPAPVTAVPTVPTQTLPPPAAREGSTKLSETLPSSSYPGEASGRPASSDTPAATHQHRHPYHARVQWESDIKLEVGDCGTQASVHQGKRDGSCNITVRPKLPQAPALPWLQSLEAPQATELCDICGFDTERDNLIVYCESCHMGVHQTCYGISKIPTKEWYCSPCSAGVHPSTLSCRFCPVKGGALKRCTDGSWGHILCAFWIPECCFLDPDKMEPIGSINKRGEAGQVERFLPTFRSRKCYICGTTTGCAIRCHSPSCKFHLHPMCGSKAGSVYMEIETMMKTGSDGKEYESVSLVARCPRHDKRKRGINLRDRKSRGLVSSADPLGVAGRTLELKDPKRGDGMVLNGKVTWFDSVRSRYCVVESSSNSGTGSGDATTGLAHWIAADKLVEVEAVCTQTQRRERFVVKQPTSARDGGRESKSEDKAEEGGGATLNCHERAKKQADEINDKSSSGKCSERDEFGVLGPPDAPSSKRASFEAQTRTGTRSRCDSKTIQQEQAHASQAPNLGELDQTCLKMTESTSKGGATSTSAIQTGGGESDVVVPAGKQRRKDRLPAVQFLIDRDRSWRRYPTRGRKRQQPDTAPDHDLDIVSGFVSSKKKRLAEQDDEGGKPSTNDPVVSQNSNKLGLETASDNVPSAPEVPVAQGNDKVSSSGQTLEEQPSTEVRDKRCGLGVTGPVELETVSTEVRDTRGEIGATGPIEPDTSSTWMNNKCDKIGTAGHVEPETTSTEVVNKSEIGAAGPLQLETTSMEMQDKRGEVRAAEPVESETESTEVRDTRGGIGATGPIEPETASTWMRNKRGEIGTAGHVAPETPSTEVVDKSEIGAAEPLEPETTSMEMRDKKGEVEATGPVEPETVSAEVRDTRDEISAIETVEQASTEARGKRTETGKIGAIEPEPVKNPLARALRPGWPSGMALLGQVPVMRIRTFPVARGSEAKYFACGSADAKSVTYDQHSSPRLSFRFEHLEEIRSSCPREQIHHVQLVTDVVMSMNCDCLERAHMVSETRQEKEQTRDGSNTLRQENPVHRGDQHSEEQNQREKDEGAVTAAESDPESDASSPPSLNDVSEMEDGEIETSTDGRAKIMPCSPLDSNMGSVKKMGRMEPEGGQVGDASQAEVEDETASGHVAGGNSARGGEEESDSEDMEISSDSLSIGEEEQEETGSLISCDKEIVDEGDDLVANSGSDSEEALEEVDTRDRTTADERADLTKPIGPGSTCIQAVNNARVTVPQGDASEDFALPTSAPQEPTAAPAAAQEAERPQPDDHLREIVRRNLEIRLSAGKVEDWAIVNRIPAVVFNRIAADVEAELFQRLYREKDKGHGYKAKYKQLLLSLGNTRNHRLVDSVLAGTTTPADLATKDAVGLLKSLNSSLNCEAVPLTGRNGQSNRRGKMVLLG